MIIKLFGVIFFVVAFINQAFYGFCFQSYCLLAALQKVFLVSAILTGIGYATIENRQKVSKELTVPFIILGVIWALIVIINSAINSPVPCTTDADCYAKNPHIRDY